MSAAPDLLSAAQLHQQQIHLLAHLQQFPQSMPSAVFSTCPHAGEHYHRIRMRLLKFCRDGLLVRSGAGARVRYALSDEGAAWLREARGPIARKPIDRVLQIVPPRRPDVMGTFYLPPAMPAMRRGALDHMSYRSLGHGS